MSWTEPANKSLLFGGLVPIINPFVPSKWNILSNARGITHNMFISASTLQIILICSTKQQKISRQFVTKAPKTNWCLHMHHKATGIALYISNGWFSAILPWAISFCKRLKDSKPAGSLLKLSLSKIPMVIGMEFLRDANELNKWTKCAWIFFTFRLV